MWRDKCCGVDRGFAFFSAYVLPQSGDFYYYFFSFLREYLKFASYVNSFVYDVGWYYYTVPVAPRDGYFTIDFFFLLCVNHFYLYFPPLNYFVSTRNEIKSNHGQVVNYRVWSVATPSLRRCTGNSICFLSSFSVVLNYTNCYAAHNLTTKSLLKS